MKKGDSACRAINAAANESQVLAAVRDYLASLSAADVALMPAEVMALGLDQIEDLIQSALQLVHHQMMELREAPNAAVLNEAALVLSTAAKRLATLATDTA
jgi:hypothetical protein